MNQKMLIKLIAIPIFLAIVILGFAVFKSMTHSEPLVNNFSECAALISSKIMESYPRQCQTDAGEIFVEEVTVPTISEESYYGSSTNTQCQTVNDCQAQGCNLEICGGVGEEITSICLAPSQPTASQLGYTCACVRNQCQWSK